MNRELLENAHMRLMSEKKQIEERERQEYLRRDQVRAIGYKWAAETASYDDLYASSTGFFSTRGIPEGVAGVRNDDSGSFWQGVDQFKKDLESFRKQQSA